MKDVLERRSGYSDKMMHEQCLLLQRVVSQTVTKTRGRGRHAKKVEVLRHDTDPEIIDRINRSVEHYKAMTEKKLEFRDYQAEIITKGKGILSSKGMLYLSMEVRTGKTLTSLGIAEELGYENVLFITKKKAMSSIAADTDLLCPSYVLFIINYESLHKIPDVKWDLIICDEAHGMGAYPKPNNRAKAVKALVSKCSSDVIFLSGTPTPESYSMIYHQAYVVPNNPFRSFKNFYDFARLHVNIKQIKINGMMHKNYDDAPASVMDCMKPYTISYTQSEAGFKVDTKEHVLYVEMKPVTYALCQKLQKDLVVAGKDNDILGDTPVKLMQKLHQMYSGTVKFESGDSMVLDYTKAEFIRERFKQKKIGIFYKFKEELNALKEIYGDDLTTELEEFEETGKSIALQIVSGREGISLSKASALVYYNIDFSATSYWQSRDRMTTKDRLKSDVYWVFSRGGIEDKIYKAVSAKKAYTVTHFKKDHGSKAV